MTDTAKVLNAVAAVVAEGRIPKDDYQLLVQLLGELAERRENAAERREKAEAPARAVTAKTPAVAQPPSVGRMVHFTGSDGSGPYPAIIVEVVDVVRLCTFGPSSIYFQSAPLAPAAGVSGHWCWPPYVPGK